MSLFQRRPASNVFHTDRFTRGGQIFSHEWRMRLQNMRVVLILSLLFALVGVALSAYFFDLSCWLLWDFYICSYLFGHFKVLCWPVTKDILYFFDQLLTIIMPGSKGIPAAHKAVWQLTTDFTTPDGKAYAVRTVEFLKHSWTLKHVSQLHSLFWVVFSCWVAGVGVISWFFKRKSKKIEEEKVLKGKEIKVLSQIFS